MSAPVRAALVGYGLAGRVFHAPLMAAAGIAVATVVTADPERAAQARRDHPAARVVPDVQDVWDAAAAHDLVVVASANRAHAPQARAALDHGLAVVVDKPLAVTSAEAAALVAHARARGRMLTVFQNRRRDAEILTAKGLIEAGGIGRVVRLESRFTRWRPAPREGAWRESRDPADGGGLLLDLGVHLVDQAIMLLGPPERVYAEVAAVRDPGGPDDDVFVALHHPGGAVSHLWASAVAADAGARLRVLGTAGAYVAPHLDGQEDALRAGADPASPGWGAEPSARWGAVVRGEERVAVPSTPGDWPWFYRAVARALREGGPPPVDPSEAVAVLRVLEAARRSAAEGRVVPVTG